MASVDAQLTSAEARKGGGALTEIARAARLGGLTAVIGAAGLWVGDALAWSREGSQIGWGRWVTAMGASLLVSVTAALLAGAALGPFVVPVVEIVIARVRSFVRDLREGDEPTQHAVASKVLGTVGLLVAAAWPVYRASFAITVGLARPESMALALVVTHLALFALMVTAWPVGVRVARFAIDAVSTTRIGARLTRRASTTLTLVAAAVAASAGATAMTYRETLASLPWQEVQTVPGLVVGLVGGALVITRGSARAKRVVAGIVIAATLVGAVLTSRVRPEAGSTRRLAFVQSLGGRLGYSAWTAALDVDRDGQLNVLGGGDCAPFDPNRHAGAIDIPGNGIDEDCDNLDLPPLFIKPRARKDVGQWRLPMRPDIVLITVDGLAARHLATLGSPKNTMPHVDQLAAKGALFTSCFSEGPSTRLSFPSMFTSKWDSELVFAPAPRPPYSVRPGERQIQDWLSEGGWEGYAVLPHQYFDPGKWPGVTHGFRRVDGAAIKAGKNNAPQVTDEAISILSERSENPVYLWVHYYDAHAPYQAPPGSGKEGASDEALYDAELTFIDNELARLLAAIDARPDQTYVLLTADHGTAFHPHPSARHARYGYDLYTATLHVPLIVVGPYIEPRRIDTLASTMDVGPTIVDIVRRPEPPGVEGTSLVPELLTDTRDDARVIFSEYFLGERDYEGRDPLEIVSARSITQNLILDRVHGVFELYDWVKDYWEEEDLYEDRMSSPDVVKLRGLLGTFVQQFHKRPTGAAAAPPPK